MVPVLTWGTLTALPAFLEDGAQGDFAYTGDAGWAITAGIPVKFVIAHGKSVPEVGSVKCIGAYGRKGVPPAPQIFGSSKQNMITPIDLLRPIHNFYSLTICS